MFCPKCGTADQVPETYCRQCGIFLPDIDKPMKKAVPAEEHLKINSFFSLATAIVSISLAIALYSIFLGQPGTHWIIYLVAGFLTAMTAWQVQVFIRTRMLKKQIAKMRPVQDSKEASEVIAKATNTAPLLNEPDMEHFVPASVVEHTTRQLSPELTKSK